MEELAQRRAATPHLDLFGPRQLGLMCLADQRWHDVTVGKVIVVAPAIEVGRHRRDAVHPVLAAIGLAQLDPGDLGDRVPLVGRLQRPGEQRFLGDRLGSELGVDARRAEEQQLGHPRAACAFDHIRLDHQVVIKELGRIRVVGMDPTDPRRGDDRQVRALGLKPREHRALIAQVERVSARTNDVARFCGKTAHHRATDHAAVARDPDLLVGEVEVHAPCPSGASRIVTRSAATISAASWRELVSCFQPSF